MKALVVVVAFNQEKAQVGAFSVIVQLHCSFYSTTPRPRLHIACIQVSILTPPGGLQKTLRGMKITPASKIDTILYDVEN